MPDEPLEEKLYRTWPLALGKQWRDKAEGLEYWANFIHEETGRVVVGIMQLDHNADRVVLLTRKQNTLGT